MLTDTIYTVAAAQFSSEMSEDQFCWRKHTNHISWKRRAEDDPNREAVFPATGRMRQLRVFGSNLDGKNSPSVNE